MKKLLAAALAALVCGTTPVFAEEDADYVILAHVDYDYERMQQGSMTYIAGSTSGMGIILQSKTDLFGKGEHLDMRCLIYVIRGSEELDLMAPCTVTNAGKEQLNVMAIRKARNVQAGGGGQGVHTLREGTGRFAEVSGSCAYQTDYLPGDRFVTTTRCTLER